MYLERLYIHRVEPVKKDNCVVLEPLPPNLEQGNLGITYRLAIIKSDPFHATCYGWQTGYGGGGFDAVPWPEADVSAPQGFIKGKFAFVTAKDSLLGVSTRDQSSADAFLASLEKFALEDVIKELQGFSFVGIIE